MATKKKKGSSSASKKSSKKTSKKSSSKSSKKTKKKSSKKESSKKSSKKKAKKESKKPEKKAADTSPKPVEKQSGMGGLGIAVAILIIIALGAIVWISLDSQQGDQVLATVNGEPVYAAEIQEQYDRLPANMQQQFNQSTILEQTIDKMLVLEAAKEAGITVSEEDIDARIDAIVANLGISESQLLNVIQQQNLTEQDYREAVAEEIILTRYAQQEVIERVEVSDAQIQDYYQSNIDQFSAGEGQMRIRHILVDDEDLASSLAQRARAGEDFASLAEQYSTGPSGPQGGDLGFVSNETNFVAEFKEVALDLEVGEISDPVQTQFGWHVIMRDEDSIPIEEATPQIRQALQEQLASTQFEQMIRQMREDAEISYVE